MNWKAWFRNSHQEFWICRNSQMMLFVVIDWLHIKKPGTFRRPDGGHTAQTVCWRRNEKQQEFMSKLKLIGNLQRSHVILWNCQRLDTRVSMKCKIKIQERSQSVSSALTVAADAVLAVLGRLGAAATLRQLLVVSGEQSFNLRGDLPLIHGRTPLLVLRTETQQRKKTLILFILSVICNHHGNRCCTANILADI